jgi:aryl-alcohol dehydrogenase-like predicted oxidoreductase
LDDVVKSGKVRYIGASNVAAWHLMKALSYSTFHRMSKFVSLQAYYTIASRELEREMIPLLKDQNTGLMVWSPLAGGFLTGKFKREGQNDANARRTNFDFPVVDKDKAFRIVDALTPMASAKGASIAQLAIAWLLHQSVVTSVIIGAKSVDQLDDNIKSIDIKFSADELNTLEEVSKLGPEYPGWMLEFTAGDRKK